MKLSEFILLSENEKKVVLLHDGVLVGKRKYDQCCIFLFRLGQFYVELYGDLAKKQVNEYRLYADVGKLTPYLDSIKLDGLL